MFDRWNAKSCVHGKHYICQKKVSRVGEKGLRKLKAKYNVDENNQLNEIPIPMTYYNKPYKRRDHENQSNGHGKTGLKHHGPGYLYDPNSYNAFAHRKNSTELKAGRRRDRERNRKERKNRRDRKNRKNKNKHLQSHIRNGTDHSLINSEFGYGYQHKNRNRRNKSKENNSAENTNLLHDDLKHKKHKHHHRVLKDSSMEAITQKTTYLSNTISPLYPRVIVEEHDFP